MTKIERSFGSGQFESWWSGQFASRLGRLDPKTGAMKEFSLKGAGLDVYEDEPRVHSGLLTLENVVLVPHMASATAETRAAMYDLVARNVVNVLSGRPPVTPIP